MRTLTAGLMLLPLCVVLLSGCPIGPTETSVFLVNTTGYPVSVELYYDDDQFLTEALLELNGERYETTLAPGETQSFSRDCTQLQSIFIRDADMQIAIGVSPEASTRVYREPDDFGCGDSLRFTFTTGVVPVDLDISFSQQQ